MAGQHAGIRVWTSRLLSQAVPVHFFTARLGGISPAPFDSLNLGLTTRDRIENVEENRRRVEEQFGARLSALAWQVHGDQVLVLKRGEDRPDESSLPNADAIVSSVPALPIAMFFADCLPLYFWDPVSKAGGMAHAGWRSTMLDIGPKTVETLGREFGSRAEELLVAFGPSIGPCCFQVGPDVEGPFHEKFGAGVVRKSEGKTTVDLWEANRLALLKKGVKGGNMEVAGECTSCQRQLYFSYRRDKGETGRMAGVIKLPT